MLGKIAGGRQKAAQASKASRPTTITERELVLAFKAGQAQAYGDIYRRYLPMVQHICRRLLKNPDDVQEATQETMLRVFQGLPRFNGRYLLQAWVARIATNVSLDVLRSKARHPEAPEILADDLGELVPTAHARVPGDPSEEVARRLESDQIRAILSALPKHHREALVLRSFNGMSHEEIGERLEMTPAQVKALIHRAKGSFRKEWDATAGRGIAVLWPVLLWPAKLPRLLKRFFGLEAAPVAQVSQAAASPAVTNLVSVGGERIAAAVAVVIVAGTAGAGALVSHHRHSAPAPRLAQASPIADVQTSSADAKPVHDIKKLVAVDSPEPTPSPEATTSTATPDPSPSPDASPSPDPSPSPEGPTEPSTGPTETPPPPTPAEAPEPEGFTVSFQSDATTDYRCSCGVTPSQDGWVSVAQDGSSTFSQRIRDAAAADASGQAAWALTVDQSSDGSSHQMRFVLEDDQGGYYYDATGRLLSRDENEWGGWRYVFTGTYSRSSSPTAVDEMPQRGTYTVAVSLSKDGTRFVSVTVALTEGR